MLALRGAEGFSRDGRQLSLRARASRHHRALRRFPHRNAVLGRPSTREESSFSGAGLSF